MDGRRYKLWHSRKEDTDCDVGIMVKLYQKMVEVRIKSDKVMTVVLVFEEDMLRLICVYIPQSERSKKKSSMMK